MSAAMIRRLVWIALCVSWSTSVSAQELSPPAGADFAPASEDWNGLSYLSLIARDEQIELDFMTELDYSALDIREPLLIIEPSEELRAESLARFVGEGGQVWVVDDSGASASFLQRLDIVRIVPTGGALPHDELLYGNPALPIFRPQGIHPMLEKVRVVVANHPSVLTNIGGPVVSYSEDGGLVYDMNLGQGKAVVMADSSLLINHMLSIADNAQLARNTLKYLCKGQTACRVRVYIGAFEQRGVWGEVSGLSATREELARDVTRLNDKVREAMAQLPAERLFYYISVLLLFGAILYLYAIFPIRRPRPHSDQLREAQRPQLVPQSEFDWNLGRYMDGTAGMNYALPVSIMKEVFEELFLKGLGRWEPAEAPQASSSHLVEVAERRLDARELAEVYRATFLKDYPQEQARKLERHVIELLEALARVPTRHRVFLEQEVYFSERDLLRLHKRCMDVLEQMKLKEDYEHRTRHLG